MQLGRGRALCATKADDILEADVSSPPEQEARTAETSITREAWLKLAATWLALIPVSREAASERSKAMEQPVSGTTSPLRPDKGGEDYQSSKSVP